MRTFVAVELPDEVRTALAAIQSELAAHAGMLKLVDPHLMHVTVRFLGDVEPARLPHLGEGVRAACRLMPPFTLRLGQVGAFPQRGTPRVVWVGLRQDDGYAGLQALFEGLETPWRRRASAGRRERFRRISPSPGCVIRYRRTMGGRLQRWCAGWLLANPFMLASM